MYQVPVIFWTRGTRGEKSNNLVQEVIEISLKTDVIPPKADTSDKAPQEVTDIFPPPINFRLFSPLKDIKAEPEILKLPPILSRLFSPSKDSTDAAVNFKKRKCGVF